MTVRTNFDVALRAFREGDALAAAAAAQAVLADDPTHADALVLLAALARRSGDLGDARGLLERAMAADPEHRSAATNHAAVLLAAGDLAAADRAYVALRVRWDGPEAALGHARARRGLGDRAGWRAAAEAAVRLAGGDPTGRSLRSGGPSEIAALRELGFATFDDDPEAGRAILSRVALVGDAASALALGRADARRGPEAAVRWLRVAARAELSNSDDARPQVPSAAVRELVDAVSGLVEPLPELAPDLPRLAELDGIDPQRLEPAMRALVLSRPEARRILEGAGSGVDLARVLGDSLFVAWCTRTLVCGVDAETLLRNVRAALADDLVDRGVVPLGGVVALAHQAWLTDFAWPTTEDDRVPDPSPDELGIAVSACFRPLAEVLRDAGQDPVVHAFGPLAPLVRAQLVEPAEERALAASIPSLLPGPPDPTSAVVRERYERRPYPRLVPVIRGENATFDEWLGGCVGEVGPTANPRVLVAGCGTGQHPAQLAARLSTTEVVAVDLSIASLARAARIARRAGLTNLRFQQADLLDIRALGLTYSFVDCVGVLHHLADPARGLVALAAVLRPDGWLRLGVYSARARAYIDAARALHGDAPTTDDGLRAFRERVRGLPPDHPAAPVRASIDFHSLAGVADLVFHPCEHRYSPVSVAALARSAGLEPRFIQPTVPAQRAAFRRHWGDAAIPDTPGAWEDVERTTPSVFAGMIHLWCRK